MVVSGVFPESRQEGCGVFFCFVLLRGDGGRLVSVGLTQKSAFQVDDAMLMFDKTTNRHRGKMARHKRMAFPPLLGFSPPIPLAKCTRKMQSSASRLCTAQWVWVSDSENRLG